MKMRICLLGDGGFAKEVAWTANELSLDVIASVADKDTTINEKTKDWDWFARRDWDFVAIAVGKPVLRIYLANKAREVLGFEPEWMTLISPRAHVAMDSLEMIGRGAIIQPGAIIMPNVRIGANTVVNINATIGHDTIIGENCVINPGANISGNVQMGKKVFVGTGAQILEKLFIGDFSTIGASACVREDVMAGTTVVGVPAKPANYR